MNTNKITVDGVELCYEIRGDGAPMLFVHGWSLDFNYWSAQRDFFTRQHRFIAYDLRGMGCSGEGPKGGYPFEQLVSELDGVLNQLSNKPPILIGHSLGGSLVTQYAVEHSDKIAALVIVAAALPNYIEEQKQLIEFRDAVQQEEFASTEYPTEKLFWSAKFRSEHPDVIASWGKQYLSNDPKNLVDSLASWAHRRDPKPGLRNINVPTRTIVGSCDAYNSVKAMAELTSLIPGATLSVIDGAGHMCFVEQPKAFNDIVDNFMAPFAAAPVATEDASAPCAPQKLSCRCHA
jgi:pimeloyl-ACP methyl ester carboxylesterase